MKDNSSDMQQQADSTTNLPNESIKVKKYRTVHILDNQVEPIIFNQGATRVDSSVANENAISALSVEDNKIRSIILLHGWGQNKADMDRLKDRINRDLRLAHLPVYCISYPYTTPFNIAGKLLRDELQSSGIIDKNTLVVGYSMGGVVARQLYVDGYKFKKLVTICSPHQGLLPWIPTPEPGSSSLSPISSALFALNNHPEDIRKRADYSFFGITYRDIRGHFEDDGVVGYKSAVGDNLGGAISRHKIHMNYNWAVIPPDDPHSRGWKAEGSQLDPVISHIRSIIIQDQSQTHNQRVTLGDYSNVGPALATLNNTLLLGWVGAGNNFLNFMRSNNGVAFSDKVVLSDVTAVTPGLSSFRDKFVVAWIGIGNNYLNVMQSSNGTNWQNKITLNEQSESSPALTVFNNQLFLAWRGKDNNYLNVMRSVDGVNWSQKVTLTESTLSGPSLAVLGANLFLAWRGVGNNQLNIMRSSDGVNFSEKITLNETTLSRPYLHAHRGRLVYAWQGVDNNMINKIESKNGSQWEFQKILQESCTDGPVLASVGKELVWGWTGNESRRRLNTLIYTPLEHIGF